MSPGFPIGKENKGNTQENKQKTTLNLPQKCLKICSYILLYSLKRTPRSQEPYGALWPTQDISNVVLTGGSARIPKVQQLLTEFFEGKELVRSARESQRPQALPRACESFLWPNIFFFTNI